MSQIDVNSTNNSVNVENIINTIDVNQDFSNILVVPQENTSIIEINTPGPQGPKGDPGDPTPLTGSFVTTSSFFAFTSSYYIDSSSFNTRINYINDSSGSWATTGSNVFKGTQVLSGHIPTIPSPAYLVMSGSNGQNLIQFFSGSSQLGNIANIDDRLIISNPHNVGKGIRLVTEITGGIELDTEEVFVTEILRVSGSTIIGNEFLTPGANEKLLIDAGTFPSFNLITARSNVNNYSQLNITNKSSGSNASSDIVATNNIGTETTYFVNLGINSSNHAGGIGGPNDAYLYTTGSNFLIINTTPGKNLTLSSDELIIENYSTQQPVVTVSQSIVQFATQSFDPTGTTQAGSVWFTSSSFYVGLE